MDYRTRKTSREEIRRYSNQIRKKFHCRNKYYFDVIKAFEMMPILFPNVAVEIVEDDDIDLVGVPSTTIPDMSGHYTIKVKESVYDRAYTGKNGGCRMHIMHEMCHVFLFELGYFPFVDRAYKNLELEPCESAEWQAKALAGEVMIPYESTCNMTSQSIVKKCKVSTEAANKRIKLK